jgi:YVTN family beta-propeller protein
VPAGTPNFFYGVPGLAVTPDGTRLLIASFDGGVVSMIETATDTLIQQTIPVGTGPRGVGVPKR